MLQFEHVTTNPKILGGKPIIKDTRISVEFILELLASGAAVKDIVEAYPHLSEEAVNERGFAAEGGEAGTLITLPANR